MRLAVIGGGGFRTPALYAALADPERAARYTHVTLHDVDADRLERIGAVIAALATAGAPPVELTTDVDRALDGADVVYLALRVGGLAGRALDERIALDAGVIGQETAGAGGLAYALRTVPVMVALAQRIRDRAPAAIVVNFTNPVGLVTEMLVPILGEKIIGVCDTPGELVRRSASALGCDEAEVRAGYQGLNHLGWLTSLERDDEDLLPGLIADHSTLESFEEGRLFGAQLIGALGAIPNEYLYYYYFRPEALAAMRGGEIRSAYLQRTQSEFYDAPSDDGTAALARWRAVLADREARYMAEAWASSTEGVRPASQAGPGGYGGMALQVVDALAGDVPTTMILNVRNRGHVDWIDEDAVVELPCLVSRDGIAPQVAGALPMAAKGLALQVRAAERAAGRAALSGSRREALLAFTTHPLVSSATIADELVTGYTSAHPELREVFG